MSFDIDKRDFVNGLVFRERKNIGGPMIRKDALEKATGAAIFAADLKFPNQLWARFYRSPLSHAKILRIDASRAWSVPGVRAVVSGADVPYMHGISVIQDQPFLAVDRVRYVGEPIVGVAAEDVLAAEEALALIRVEFEPLPAVLDVFSAMEPGAPLLHEGLMGYPRTSAVEPVGGTTFATTSNFGKEMWRRGFANRM